MGHAAGPPGQGHGNSGDQGGDKSNNPGRNSHGTLDAGKTGASLMGHMGKAIMGFNHNTSAARSLHEQSTSNRNVRANPGNHGGARINETEDLRANITGASNTDPRDRI